MKIRLSLAEIEKFLQRLAESKTPTTFTVSSEEGETDGKLELEIPDELRPLLNNK